MTCSTKNVPVTHGQYILGIQGYTWPCKRSTPKNSDVAVRHTKKQRRKTAMMVGMTRILTPENGSKIFDDHFWELEIMGGAGEEWSLVIICT